MNRAVTIHLGLRIPSPVLASRAGGAERPAVRTLDCFYGPEEWLSWSCLLPARRTPHR
jgi:hypothetical protein